MPQAVIMIGAACSGKSTFAAQSVRDTPNLVVVCPDAIRAELGMTTYDRSFNISAWETTYRRIAETLQADKPVLVDSTCVNLNKRRALIGHCRKSGADKVIGVWVDAPPALCRQRNATRPPYGIDMQVSKSDLQRMFFLLRRYPPSRADGFDEFMKVKGY